MAKSKARSHGKKKKQNKPISGSSIVKTNQEAFVKFENDFNNKFVTRDMISTSLDDFNLLGCDSLEAIKKRMPVLPKTVSFFKGSINDPEFLLKRVTKWREELKIIIAERRKCLSVLEDSIRRIHKSGDDVDPAVIASEQRMHRVSSCELEWYEALDELFQLALDPAESTHSSEYNTILQKCVANYARVTFSGTAVIGLFESLCNVSDSTVYALCKVLRAATTGYVSSSDVAFNSLTVVRVRISSMTLRALGLCSSVAAEIDAEMDVSVLKNLVADLLQRLGKMPLLDAQFIITIASWVASYIQVLTSVIDVLSDWGKTRRIYEVEKDFAGYLESTIPEDLDLSVLKFLPFRAFAVRLANSLYTLHFVDEEGLQIAGTIDRDDGSSATFNVDLSQGLAEAVTSASISEFPKLGGVSWGSIVNTLLPNTNYGSRVEIINLKDTLKSKNNIIMFKKLDGKSEFMGIVSADWKPIEGKEIPGAVLQWRGDIGTLDEFALTRLTSPDCQLLSYGYSYKLPLSEKMKYIMDLRTLFGVLLYLSAKGAEITDEKVINGVSTAKLGKNISRALSSDKSIRKPHIRRAHWHKFRVGKRGSGTPQYRLHFLPPIMVGVGNLGVTEIELKTDEKYLKKVVEEQAKKLEDLD